MLATNSPFCSGGITQHCLSHGLISFFLKHAVLSRVKFYQHYSNQQLLTNGLRVYAAKPDFRRAPIKVFRYTLNLKVFLLLGAD